MDQERQSERWSGKGEEGTDQGNNRKKDKGNGLRENERQKQGQGQGLFHHPNARKDSPCTQGGRLESRQTLTVGGLLSVVTSLALTSGPATHNCVKRLIALQV